MEGQPEKRHKVRALPQDAVSNWLNQTRSVLPRHLLQGTPPCPFFVTPCPFEKAEMTPCPFEYKTIFFFKYQAFTSVLPFLLPTHSVDCAVHLLLSHSRALLVSSALFHQFTTLIMPFWRSIHRAKVPFWRSLHRAKVPFSHGTLPFWKPGQNTGHAHSIKGTCQPPLTLRM